MRIDKNQNNHTICTRLLLTFFFFSYSFLSVAQKKTTPIYQIDSTQLKTQHHELELIAKAAKTSSMNDIRGLVVKKFMANISTDFRTKNRKDSCFLISIALAFDSSGRAEKIFLSEKISERTKAVFNIDQKLIDKMLETDFSRFGYKNKVILFPILFIDFKDKAIQLNDFLTDYVNLWPDFGNELIHKQLILLKPYINRQITIYN